jgi:hypothetical protein
VAVEPGQKDVDPRGEMPGILDHQLRSAVVSPLDLNVTGHVGTATKGAQREQPATTTVRQVLYTVLCRRDREMSGVLG